jgi:hypothetical protein
MEAPEASVVIASEDASITFTPAGPPAEYWRVSVTTVAGPFRGKFTTDIYGSAFIDLHGSMGRLREGLSS